QLVGLQMFGRQIDPGQGIGGFAEGASRSARAITRLAGRLLSPPGWRTVSLIGWPQLVGLQMFGRQIDPGQGIGGFAEGASRSARAIT
ncbi:hypothetical protein CQA86_32245, partial [Klebsiella pneumoniae]